MASQRKIQDHDRAYNLLRYYVDFALKLSYRNIRYVGRERIPHNGAIIYAPNHTNALMDALVILAMDRQPKVFVARADIFRNRRLAKIFTFLKIMPIMRIRDGFDEVKKNEQTIRKAVDVLRDRVPFCIFPEGQHQAKYSSLPLSKGIFRIAFQAQELMSDTPLYIVPVGMRYGNFFRFRSTVRVEVGEPIDVGQFIAAHPQLSSQEQMNRMRDLLTERMQQSIFHIPNDEDYDSTYEICAAVVKRQARMFERTKDGKRVNRLDAHFAANNHTVGQIAHLKADNQKRAEELLRLGREAAEERRAHKISLSSVSIKYPILSRVLKALFLLVALPYCIPASILTLPIKLTCNYLFTILKDHAFRNSVRYLLNLLLWPLLMIIYAAVAFSMLSWPWAALVTLALLPAPVVAHETWRLMRLVGSDVRLLANRGLRRKYQEIREIIFND